jgi:transposase
MEITTIGLDIAKTFQAHGANAAGMPVLRRKLRRADVLQFFQDLPRCLVGIEACGTAHHWAREITALGHEVKLLPPSYVKPYAKRGRTDAADAEAICEAVTRPGMRFVAGEDGGTAVRSDVAPDPGSSCPPADHVDQCDTRPHG